jgi:hypothetical protein
MERVENALRDFYGMEDPRAFTTEFVLDKAARTNAEFLRCMTDVTATTERLDVTFAPLVVTTLTITGKFENDAVEELPLEFIREKLKAHDGDLHLGVQNVKKYRKDTVKPPPDVRKFRHQVSFKFGKKSAKLFYNGTIHATGFSNVIEFLYVSFRIAEFVRSITNDGLALRLADFSINMINATTLVTDSCLPLSFSPTFLFKRMKANGYHADFDAERHPAVKIMLFDDGRKVSTGFVFATGNIVIFGSRFPRHVAKMFDMLARELNDVRHMGMTTPPRTTTVRKNFDLAHGYSMNSYMLCI